ncbi:MAG: autotransporter outer membrane beta-barrel domain-containing protein [Alphaproteobacteria bacterium]
MRSSTSRRSIAVVTALGLAGPLVAFGFPAAARTVSSTETDQIKTNDQDATVIVTGTGDLQANCLNTVGVPDAAIEALTANYNIRIDENGQVTLVDTGPGCTAPSSALRLNSGFNGTVTINGLLAAGDADTAIHIGDFLGNNNDSTANITIGANGTVNGDLILGGNDSISLTNNGAINGSFLIEHTAGTPAVTLINNGVMDSGANPILISDTSTGAAGTTIINNVGTFDANGNLDPAFGVMTGDLVLDGNDRAYSITNSGIFTGEISFGAPTTFGGAAVNNSGTMTAGASGNILLVNDLGDDTTVLSFTNSFLGTITGDLVFGNNGDHSLTNSGDMTGTISFGDGDNSATLASGFVQATDSVTLPTLPLLSMGAGADSLSLSGSRVQAQEGFITETTDANGAVDGFTFGDVADIQAGTLIDMGDDDDEVTIAGGAIGGADTLLDLGTGADTLTLTLNPLAAVDIDERSVISGGADEDTLAFNVAAHEDGFEFTDFGQFADFESLQVTAGALILNPDANLFGVSGGTLTINSGATLQVLDNANVTSEFATGVIDGTLRVDGNLPLVAANGTFTVNSTGLLQFGITDVTDPTLNGILQSAGGSTTVTLADGSAVELILADQLSTGFTTIGQTATVTLVEADTITIADQTTILADNDPFHEFTLIDPTTTPGLLQVEIGRTPGFQQLAINAGLAGHVGTIGAALDAEYAACSDTERDGSDAASSFTAFCNAVSILGVTSNSANDNLGIVGLLAVAAPDRTSGEHTMRVDTQKMLHSIVEKRADILRSRSRALPAGVGTGQIDKPQQQSRLTGSDRQIAGLTDNLTNEIDGTGAGDLVDFGTGLGAGSVWSAHHLWMQIYTAFSERDDSRLVGGYDGEQYGIAFGYDWRASRTWLFGVYGGYGLSEVDGNDSSNEQVEIDTISGGAYMSWFDRYTSWSSTLSFGISDFEGERIGLAGTKVTRSHDGFEVGLSSTVDQNITVAKRLILTPAFDLNFGLYNRDGYTETGTFGLTVKSKTSYSLNTGLSAKLAAPGQIGRTGVLPYIRTGVWHDFFDDSADTKAKFTGSKAGSTFKVDGIDTASTQYLAGLGLDLVSARGRVNFSFGYNFIGGDDTLSHNLNSNLRFRF